MLTLWGNMPLDDAGANEALAIEDPAEFAAAIFRQLLTKRGIVVYGVQRRVTPNWPAFPRLLSPLSPPLAAATNPRVPPNQPLVLASHESKPLIEDVQVINKVSQNLHAEILLRLLGRERERRYRRRRTGSGARLPEPGGHLPPTSTFFTTAQDCRGRTWSPRAPWSSCCVMRRPALGREFRNTLPVAGVDGSFPSAFSMWTCKATSDGKTGSLGGVKTLSGYATTETANRWPFRSSPTTSTFPPKRVTDAIDDIVGVIVHDSPAKKK